MAVSTNQDIHILNQYLGKALQGSLIKIEMGAVDHHLYIFVLSEQLKHCAEFIYHDNSLKASFTTMLALDDPDSSKLLRIHMIFTLKGSQVFLILSTQVEKENPVLPSLIASISAAEWYEREMHDLYGIKRSNISLEPLVLHRDWPKGEHFPLRKDFPIDEQIAIAEVAHQFTQPHAEGMHQVAVGPIHAGIIEPGHLRFCVTGEQIHKFDAQLFYTHKGIEKMAEGKHYKEVLALAEHVCGLCAYAHSTAYCQALEAMGDIQVPERAVCIRTICLELERLNSHMADLTAICSAGGYGFGSMHAARLREMLMQLTQHVAGHRFFRGLNTIGGLCQDIPDDSFAFLLDQLNPFKTEFKEWGDHVLECDSFLDRLETTGYLSQEQALTLGLVGPSARGSGIDKDARRDHPYAAYAFFKPDVPTSLIGDAYARTMIRIEEVEESLKLISNLIHHLPSGPVKQEITRPLPAYQPAFSLVESAKGELIHWVKLGEGDQVYRWHVRSASYMNWRGMITATMGNNIVPDGPLINKSFNLCYACVDR